MGAGDRQAYLFDTSSLIWALAAPKRLSSRGRQIYSAGGIVLSIASYWEVVIKTHKHLLDVGDPATWWRDAVEESRAHVLSIRASHVTALVPLPPHHKDPFDRMLVAQAISEDLTLVTNDEQFRQYSVRVVW